MVFTIFEIRYQEVLCPSFGINFFYCLSPDGGVKKWDSGHLLYLLRWMRARKR